MYKLRIAFRSVLIAFDELNKVSVQLSGLTFELQTTYLLWVIMKKGELDIVRIPFVQ